MMLRTDLDHLPFAMQQELHRVAAMLFEGFDALKAHKTADRYRSGHIVKLILYGAHAAEDWQSVPAGAPIRLLAIMDNAKLASRRDDWTMVRDRLRRAWEYGEIAHLVRLTVHGLRAVNHALTYGIPYFVSIATEGIALYQLTGARLHPPRKLADSRRRERGRAEFARWYGLASEFLLGAAFYGDRGHALMAALLLHQACELLYRCVARSLTLHGPNSHALDELRETAEELDPRLATAWPRDTPFERRAFGCIRRAYVEARYGQRFRITDDELAFAFSATRTLRRIVERVCRERLSDPALSASSAYPARESDHVGIA